MNLREPSKRSLAILLASLLILGNTFLHAHVYSNRNYREDEISTVHSAIVMDSHEIVRWLASDVHPPGWLLFADLWIEQFGTSEAVVRWSSKLLTLLSYALIFQLGKHLIDRRAAIYAVALLGLYGFASNNMFEVRPYTTLIALATALHLVFLRWLSKPTGTLMVVYVSLGVAAVYTHFYAFVIFAAHALFMLIFRRWDRWFMRRTATMWFFIGLSFAPWIPPLIQTFVGPFAGGYYAVDLPTLIQQIGFSPAIILEFLLIASLFSRANNRNQFAVDTCFAGTRYLGLYIPCFCC